MLDHGEMNNQKTYKQVSITNIETNKEAIGCELNAFVSDE